jgi:dolichol-phosphate mannosyltransferase
MPPVGFDCFLIGRPAIDFLTENREIHVSLPGLLVWGGFPTTLVPYDRVAREEGDGGSRWTLAKKLKYFLDAVISFSYAPLRWRWVVGAGFTLLAFAYATS